MSTVAEWDQIYNNTLEMLSKVKSALDPRSGTKDFAKVQTQLDIIANKISTLEGSLNSANTQGSKIKLAERDLRRRSNMIAGLKREKADCDGKMVSMGGNLKRKEQLFNSNFDSEKISKQSDAELHNMQEQIFAHQEQALVDISDVLGRLHDIGTAIGDEADAHVKLLDEMDGNVDVANNRLAQESKRAKQVSKNTSMCKWYSVIILLLISLIYLIVYYIKM